MTGFLKIVGIGPGGEGRITPEAFAALQGATDIIGYEPYLAALPENITATRHASGNGVEVQRAEFALSLAAKGAKVAIVSGGDAGIFGMAAAVFEAVEGGDKHLREIDIEVIPGLSAMQAAAARVGAPLGHDFCVISLSTYLKPWEIIEKRLRAAADGDFVLAIYNPASKHRSEDLQKSLALLGELCGGNRVAIIATQIGRGGEKVTVTTLGELNPAEVTPLSLLLIGSSKTRIIEREGELPFVFTPRFYKS